MTRIGSRFSRVEPRRRARAGKGLTGLDEHQARRSASKDAIDRRLANAGEPVHTVLAEAGCDGSAYARLVVTGHRDPLDDSP
jgi:hypothetical protein